MNGIDPAPQDVSLEERCSRGHRVKVLLYNQQVTDSLTELVPRRRAKRTGIPVVGVYETMPARLRLPVVDARRGATRSSAPSPSGISTERL